MRKKHKTNFYQKVAFASTFKLPINFNLLKGHLEYLFSRSLASSPSPYCCPDFDNFTISYTAEYK